MKVVNLSGLMGEDRRKENFFKNLLDKIRASFNVQIFFNASPPARRKDVQDRYKNIDPFIL